MSLGYTENYAIHRIVFVNSGSSAYVELPMNKTAALYGRNNEGKTSGLSALKLFVLPEVNFKDCQNKFGFSSSGEFHTAQQSYQYYFPDNSSFIIMEAENWKGRFCMVLHRSSEEWGYGRVAIDRPYSEICGTFWNFDSERNSGFGEPIEDLRLPEVLTKLKKLGGIPLSTKQDIRDAIYRRPGPLDDNSKFCIVPLLQKGERGSVEALSALLGLAFDIKGKTSNSLPHAIATIIEGESTSSDTRLDIDVGSITTEYQELRARNRHLNIIRDSGREWDSLKANYESLMEANETISRDYLTLSCNLARSASNAINEQNTAGVKLNTALNEKVDAATALNACKTDINEIQASIKVKSKDKAAAEADVTRIGEVEAEASEIGHATPEAILTWLEEEKEVTEESLRTFENRSKGQESLERVSKEVITLDNKVRNAEQSLNAVNKGTLDQLKPSASDSLYSLNPALAQVDSHLSDSDVAVVEAFADLLGNDGGGLTFNGAALPDTPYTPYDNEAERARRAKALDELKADLKEARKKQDRLNKDLKSAQSPEFTRRRIAELKEELKVFDRDIELIGGKGIRTRQLQELTDELEILDGRLESKTKEREKKEDAHSAATLAHAKLDSEVIELKTKSSDLNRLKDTVKAEAARLPRSISDTLSDPNEADGEIQPLAELTANAERFMTAAREFPALHQEVIRLFGVMFDRDILKLTVSPVQMGDIRIRDIIGWYDQLRAEFSNLEGNLKKHRDDIISHNATNSMRAGLLKQVGKTIEAFIIQINEELSQYQVSNLEAVRISLALDPRFLTLLKDFSDESFSGDQLKNESFYERLSAFCDDFFKDARGSQRIELTKVITGVHYHFLKDGEETDAGQSNGTTSMLNSAMLAILLKRLIPGGVILQFPIVFDEVGSLDRHNLNAVKKVAEDHGFLLFVANPEHTGVISSTISQWYDLSMLRVTEGSVVGRCTVLFHSMAEGFTPIQSPEAVSEG